MSAELQKTSFLNIDAQGIIHKEFAQNATETLADAHRSVEEVKRLSGDAKALLLIDLTNVHTIDPDAREYYASAEAARVLQAAAGVSKSLLGTLFANFFLKVRKTPYPVKMFSSKEAAKEWLLGMK